MLDLLKCFDYFAQPNAENQSWICLNGSHEPENCFFLYHQQFGRPNECAIAGASLTFLLLLCSIPANIANFISFYRRKVKPEFLFLLGVYSSCNILMAFYGAFSGIVRLFEDWIFGQIGCVVSFNCWMILMTMSMWTVTMISYERKVCICNWNSKNPNESRLVRIVVMVLVLALVNFGMYVHPFFFLKVAKVLEVSIDNETYRVCSIFTKSTLRYLVDIVYFLITFLIPFLFNIYSYL